MLREKIKVGAKSKSQRTQLVLSYNRPQTDVDIAKLCPDEAARASLFNRGYTIWLQDRFGRPMFEANRPEAEIQATFDAAIPGVTKGLTRAAAPVTVALEKGKKQWTRAEVEAMARAAGLVIVEE
jgi:hypothetical protein